MTQLLKKLISIWGTWLEIWDLLKLIGLNIGALFCIAIMALGIARLVYLIMEHLLLFYGSN